MFPNPKIFKCSFAVTVPVLLSIKMNFFRVSDYNRPSRLCAFVFSPTPSIAAYRADEFSEVRSGSEAVRADKEVGAHAQSEPPEAVAPRPVSRWPLQRP